MNDKVDSLNNFHSLCYCQALVKHKMSLFTIKVNKNMSQMNYNPFFLTQTHYSLDVLTVHWTSIEYIS